MTGRFRTGWRRFIPAIGYSDVLAMFALATIALLSLLIAGCSSSAANMPNIYTLSAAYTASPASNQQDDPTYLDTLRNLTQSARIEVRAGFAGVCVRQLAMIEGSTDWICGNAPALQNQFTIDRDPLQLIMYLNKFSQRVTFYGLFIASIVLLVVTSVLLFTFPRWHTTIDDDGDEEEVKPFPSRIITYLVLYLSAAAAIFGMVSILWTHIAAIAFAESLDQLLSDLVTTSVGATAIGIGWAALGLNLIVVIGIWVMIMSLQLLRQLTEYDD